MGGLNSGKHGGRRTTGSLVALDIRKIHNESMPGAIAATVTFNGVTTTVKLDWTLCNYGGKRAWWLCPQCGKRVALLYLGREWACRQCHCLAYQSDRVAKADKPFKRANAVRDCLGWGGGVASPMGDKPRYMHWTTYERLLRQLHRHSQFALVSSQAWVDRVRRKTDKVIEDMNSIGH